MDAVFSDVIGMPSALFFQYGGPFCAGIDFAKCRIVLFIKGLNRHIVSPPKDIAMQNCTMAFRY